MNSPDHRRGNRQNHFKHHLENFPVDPKRVRKNRGLFNWLHGGPRKKWHEQQRQIARLQVSDNQLSENQE